MLRHVVVDCIPEARQQIDTPFALDQRQAYPVHILASHSSLRPYRPSDCTMMRINFGHLKHEIAVNKMLSTCLGDEAVFSIFSILCSPLLTMTSTIHALD